MQLLIVHHDAEMGSQLVQMVRGLHGTRLRSCPQRRRRDQLGPASLALRSSLEGDGIDGLVLGSGTGQRSVV